MLFVEVIHKKHPQNVQIISLMNFSLVWPAADFVGVYVIEQCPCSCLMQME